MTLKILSLSELKQCITMPEAIAAMERAFIQLAHNNTVMPLRTGIEAGNKGLTLTMPAYLAQERILGLKVVSVFPDNVKENKPSINGVILLLDAETGEPLMLMDAAYLTALRTGAVSGLATKYFSRNQPSIVTIVGSGVQAITQLQAVHAVRQIERVFVWSRHVENARKFAEEMSSCYDIEVCEQLSPALQQSDIICTATVSAEPFVFLGDLQAHAHINAIGSHSKAMREISSDVLQRATVIVDQKEASMSEAGEIIAAIDEQKLQKESLTELGSWLVADTSELQNTLTVFKSVGLAIQDLSVAQVVYNNALAMNLGSNFKLN
jgi:ornithine cyclodeaminase